MKSGNGTRISTIKIRPDHWNFWKTRSMRIRAVGGTEKLREVIDKFEDQKTKTGS